MPTPSSFHVKPGPCPDLTTRPAHDRASVVCEVLRSGAAEQAWPAARIRAASESQPFLGRQVNVGAQAGLSGTYLVDRDRCCDTCDGFGSRGERRVWTALQYSFWGR